jgi:hypothetical protein
MVNHMMMERGEAVDMSLTFDADLFSINRKDRVLGYF